ncbi:MAG: hypothetical protein WD851_12215 [Pirellulales bacterium]
MAANDEGMNASVRHDARARDSLPIRKLVNLVDDLQRLMYAESLDGREIWDPAKQSRTSPADLQQDLEQLMRRYGLLPAPTTADAKTELHAVLSRTGCADLTAIVTAQHGKHYIRFPGYSNRGSEFGPVIRIELDDAGHPQLRAWTDIRCNNPTHTLRFARAMDERTVV